MKVFVSGSRAIKQLDENVRNLLFDEFNSGVTILVGDADGVDAEIQRFCNAHQYNNVVVFATNGRVRNKLGDFAVKNISVDRELIGREYFTQKDIAMTDMADYGIVIWDGKSKGSLNNILRLLRQNKPCYVYSNKLKKSVMVERESDIYSFLR